MSDLNNVTMNDVLNKAIDGYRPWFPDTVPTHKIAEAVIATLAEHDRKVKADALREAAENWRNNGWGHTAVTWLDDRADTIEKGAGE
jgi:hypothetical protein